MHSGWVSDMGIGMIGTAMHPNHHSGMLNAPIAIQQNSPNTTDLGP